MSQSRRPTMGPMGGGYPPQGGQYMGQQMNMPPGQPQRFMMASQQMTNPMYNQGQMYMPTSGGVPMMGQHLPQPSQIQQIQNMVSGSPKQPSPAPSDHGSTHSSKPDDSQDAKFESNLEDPSGENSRGSTGGLKPVPSPAGSTGSRSNTPASIPGTQSGSPMPVRPPSGQIDGQNRMTQSPMAAQGYNQQMMPPPNSMGYVQGPGKLGGQMPGHYPQYNAQYPQGNYPRQQTSMSGPMQGYPGSQTNMYPNGQMTGAPMYGNMHGINRTMTPGYGPGPYPQGGMMNSQYGNYGSVPMHGGQLPPHSMAQGQQQQQQPTGGSQTSNIQPQQGGMMPQHVMTNKPMLAAVGSPRISHTGRGSQSPSRGMFSQGPLAQINNMANSPNLGSPSLNSMSNAVEQLGRTAGPSPTPVPKQAPSPASINNNMPNSQGSHHSNSLVPGQVSPLSNTDIQESNPSRPNSTMAQPPDGPTSDTTGSEGSSSGMPSDSTSIDSGFHSSDQGDKTSDSVSTPSQQGPSPPPSAVSVQPNGDSSRVVENISPPGSRPPSSHFPNTMADGVPLPPSSLSSTDFAITTTAVTGPVVTRVTQSISSPVTSVSNATSHMQPHLTQGMGGHGAPPHVMGPNMSHPHHMMPNGMPAAGMMNPNHMSVPPGGPGQMMGVPPGMMPPHSMSMNQNGPMMGPNGPMMTPGGMMQGPPSNHIPPMGHPQGPPMNCVPPITNTSTDDPPEKKKKKKSNFDLNKIFDMGNEPGRRPFLERLLAFLEETGNPITAMPVISKTPLDLFKLYLSVKEKGGFEEVTRTKRWKDICSVVNIGSSASAAFTLKKNYIRYLFSYECKFDRGGMNPAPILAQLEAQQAHKRDQKNKQRVPSPGSNNSNDAFRPPSNPNNQMDGSYPQNMPPPYMQHPDSMGPNQHMMMPPNSMMAGPHNMPPNMGIAPQGSMMAGPPGSGMMPNQQGSHMGGMIPGPPHMMPGGYGNSMIPQAQPHGQVPSSLPPQQVVPPPSQAGSQAPQAPLSHTGSYSTPPPSTTNAGQTVPSGNALPGPDSVNLQDPFSDDLQRNTGTPQQTPPPPPTTFPTTANSVTTTSGNSSTTSRPPSLSGQTFTSAEQPMPSYPPNNNRPFEPPSTTSAGQFQFGQQFERPDRFDQSSPGMPMRPSGPTDSTGQMFPNTRFPGASPQMPVMRAPISSEGGPPNPYPQPPFSQGGYPSGTPFQGYSQPHGSPSYGPRPTGPPPTPTMYGTPNKRFPDTSEHDRLRDGSQWSPLQRRVMQPNNGSYMPPVPPSTPPMGRQVGSRNSPITKDFNQRLAATVKTPYVSIPGTPLAKKESAFPPDCIESVPISTIKRKKLTHKDLAPFEAWRLVLSLKSGLLAETTWALDTLNILLYDDSTLGYFNLSTLPGLLEVLIEHFRHCLKEMFEGFSDLDTSPAVNRKTRKNTTFVKDTKESESKEIIAVKSEDNGDATSTNYTLVSRKGKPVKFDSVTSSESDIERMGKDVDVEFDLNKGHWINGGSDTTEHILTQFESNKTNSFFSRMFRRKRRRSKMEQDDEETLKEIDDEIGASPSTETSLLHSSNDLKLAAIVSDIVNHVPQPSTESSISVPTPDNHSKLCNGEIVNKTDSFPSVIKTEPVDIESDKLVNGDTPTQSESCKDKLPVNESIEESQNEIKTENPETIPENSQTNTNHVENGELEEPKLSPINVSEEDNQTKTEKEKRGGSVSPPLLKAEGLDEEMDTTNDSTAVNSTMRKANTLIIEPNTNSEVSTTKTKEAAKDDPIDRDMDTSEFDSKYTSEAEELSANIVAEMLKSDGKLEDEAFQKDDAPLCVTQEDLDQLGRKCVCISNIFRSLSFVPGNEKHLCSHPGVLYVLGRLLMLHHNHPQRPPPRKLPSGDEEEEEREEPPRVYDNDHWWWDYLDQLRENTLVILANICGYLKLATFSEQVCFPLLEGLVHWVICPASVARDPLPTLTPSSVLSPQKLVLEALCKMCIHETNVDLLLATPPPKRLMEFYNVLVRLLADKNHQITREFSIVLLSLVIQNDSSTARAIALQHPSISLLIDFVETAEQNALGIANSQGVSVLQNNPEIMGTSLDMLRRAASILLHMSRVPDNRKLFIPQQQRLLNLVMSQILDQSVANTLSDVLFECSQFS